MRPRGIGTVELVVGVVVLGLLVAGFFGVKAMVDGARGEGFTAGHKAALLEVAERDNAALAAAQERIRDLEDEKEAAERERRDTMQAIDINHEEEVARVHAQRDSVVAGIHEHYRRLRDAGGQADAGGAAGGCRASAGTPGPAGERDAAAPGDAARAVVGDEDLDVFTADLLAEGDEAIKDLTACQAIVEDWRPHIKGSAP